MKQGGILGSPICSATTAEYCQENKGITVGEIQIATLAYVDDIIDLNENEDDARTAHANALNFSRRKKLDYTPDKCNVMLVNGKKSDVTPELLIKQDKLKEVKSVVCLGDVFNSKGNNDDLVKDRVKRGTASMVSILGFMRETQLGAHTISVYLLLHDAIFLASILFNSQAWSNMTDKKIQQISAIQLKLLKKAMKARPSTANAFVYLELGRLPVKYEIHKRQLSFLHHIVHLSDEDPVRKMWRHQTIMPDHMNWWSGVKSLMSKYGINWTEDQIKEMSKEVYKKKVKEAVKNIAFEELRLECQGKKKTKDLVYTELKTQKYISRLSPCHSRTIFRARSQTLNIKDHTRYQYKDGTHCRWCGVSDETLGHIVNCGYHGEELRNVDEVLKGEDVAQMRNVAERIQDFLDRIDV